MESETDGNIDMGSLSFSPRCKKCGSHDLSFPDKPTDDSLVTCSTCRDSERWGDVKATTEAAATEKVKESFFVSFKEAFDGEEGITFKEAD